MTQRDACSLSCPGPMNFRLSRHFLLLLLWLAVWTRPVTGNNPPRLQGFDGFAQATENAPIGTIIKTLTATDQDGTSEISFRVDPTSEGKDLVELTAPWGLSTTGRSVNVTLKISNLDRDFNRPERVIRILVSDGTNEEIPATIRLFIRDVNDEKPQFKNIPYRVNIKEDTPKGSLVFNRTSVTDPDSGLGASISFSLQVNDPEYMNTFNASLFEGYIYLNGSLDYEKYNFYQLMLTATDGYGLNSTTDVIVTVIDVQDTPPAFVNTPYTTTVNEDADVGFTVITVSALDGDRGKSNDISYKFINNTYGDIFAIDSSTGEIKVNKRLDDGSNNITAQVFALTVQASEIESNPPQMGNTTATVLVTIKLQDINNNAPVFNKDSYSAEVDENSQKNIPLQLNDAGAKIQVSDGDQGVNSIFEVKVMKDGVPYDVFSVSPPTVYTSANLTIQVNNSAKLDYEALKASGSNVLVFQIVATETINDPSRHSTTATVTVTVKDVNDNFPQFTNASYEVNIDENSPEGTLVTTIQAVDRDSGSYGQVSYRFGRTESEFTINGSNGEVRVAGNAKLDREKRSQYYLTVVAEDGGGYRNTTQLIITLNDVNDESPRFLRSKYSGFLQENSPFTPLILSAFDGDEPDTRNSNVTYSLINVPDDLKGNFTIETQDGEGVISLADTQLDYEALQPPRSKITLTVVATDQGSPPKSSNVTVEISVEDKNDMSPVFMNSLYTAEVNETAEGGHFIVNVSAEDGDQSAPNNAIQYSIDSGGFEKFYIDPSTGRISVAQGARFDFETGPVFNLSVVARDKGSPQKSGGCTVKVSVKDVNDENPFFASPGKQFEINENSSVGDPVGMFTAQDLDGTSDLVYSILINKTEGRDENGKAITNPAVLQEIQEYFDVDRAKGEVFVKTNTLDRETVEYVEITIHVKDVNAVVNPEMQTATGTVTITLLDYNDNDPDFSQTGGYNVSVSEREDKGYDVITISATDKDLDRIITFRLDDPEGNFAIDPNSGKITLQKRLDRETKSSHSFIVYAMDNGQPQRSSSANVTVTVTDENDNSPQFSTVNIEVSVPENTSRANPVTTLQATDKDLGEFGAVNYFIESGNSDGKFRLNRTTGELFAVEKLDRELKSRYELRVEARDNYNDPEPVNRRNNFTTVTVIVTDVNDNAPDFNRTEFRVTDKVFEDKTLDSFVFTLTATDKDEGLNSRIRYSLGTAGNATNSAGQNLFRIEPESGTIRVANSLVDYFGMKYVTVVATDQGTPSLSSTAAVYIDITDVNNYSPVLETFPKPIYIKETNVTGVRLYTFKASDKDGGQNGKIKFLLKNNLGETIANDPIFDLNEDTGELITKIELDYETQEKYTRYIQAVDLGDVPKSSKMAVFIIAVLDIDDNPPEFDDNHRDTPLELSMEEGRTGVVGRVEAFDRDSFNTSKICYCFIGEYPDFSLNKSTGEITLLTKIDREISPGPRDLLIRALQYCTACPSSRRRKRAVAAPPNYKPDDRTMLWVRVIIKDVNDNKPVFSSPEVSVGITRDTQYGVDILSLSEYVTDKDEDGNNTQHTYRRLGPITADVENIEGDPNNMFLLSESGVVKANTYFKSNWNGFFSFQVEVKDTAGNSTSLVKIYLINYDQQVKLVILDSLANVNKSKALIVQKLENVTGGQFHIIVDKVQTHEGEDGTPDPSKMDLFIHAVNKKTKEVVNGDELLKMIDSKIELLIDFYRKYSVIKVMPGVAAATGDDDDSHLIMAIILIAVLLGLCVVVLGATFYICRNKYKRKLRAATAMAFVNTGIGAKESELSKTDMPGTNLHAFEGSNPIWMEKYADNMALDNDSQNSLDANEVESAGQNQFDEQEVSLDLYNDDYDNFNKPPASKDLQLNAAIRENEAAKNHKNKDIVNNNAAKYAINGNVNYSNGSMNSVSSFNTKSVNGLQTTEI